MLLSYDTLENIIFKSKDDEKNPSTLGYSGFVPNETFNKCTTSEILTYAAIQCLSFFDIPCSTWNIVKILNMKESTVKTNVNLLSKKRFIVRRHDGTFLFKNHKLDTSMAFLCPKKLQELHFGYWFPIKLLKDKNLNGTDKKTFSLIKSHTKTIGKCMDISYIAKKIGKSRSTASKSVNRLIENGYLSRRRIDRNSYFYETGGDMNNAGKGIGCEMDDMHENATSKPYISNKNKYINNLNEEGASSTYGKTNDSLLYLDETVRSMTKKMNDIKRESLEIDKKYSSLNKEYTNACLEKDFEKMQMLRPYMSSTELCKKIKDDELFKINGYLTDFDFYLKIEHKLNISSAHRNQIGKTIKEIIPKFLEPKITKKVFCLLMNSVVIDCSQSYHKVLKSYDWKDSKREKKAAQETVNLCLSNVKKNNYQLNQIILPEIKKKERGESKKVFLEKYSWIN